MAWSTSTSGAKNKFHAHTTDQVLFVISGEGYVASESEEVRIAEGDTAFIPAGEKHWHGAADGHDFTHIALTGAGQRHDRSTTRTAVWLIKHESIRLLPCPNDCKSSLMRKSTRKSKKPLADSE